MIRWVLTPPSFGSPSSLPISVYVWQIPFDVQLQIQSVTWRFTKQEWMSIDIYIFSETVTSMSHAWWYVSFQFVKCQLMCVYFSCFFLPPTSHTTCPNLNCVCQLTCILFLCEYLHVNFQKLCQKYTLLHGRWCDNTPSSSGCPLPRILFLWLVFIP
jgi:hypothetical protein